MNGSKQLDTALLDPASIFENPEAVLSDDTYTRAEKIEILRRWEYDASEIDAAEGEGMPAGEPSLLRRIFLALNELLGTVDVEGTPPTRQGGIPKGRIE
jgi:hypothetical protein